MVTPDLDEAGADTAGVEPCSLSADPRNAGLGGPCEKKESVGGGAFPSSAQTM